VATIPFMAVTYPLPRLATLLAIPSGVPSAFVADVGVSWSG